MKERLNLTIDGSLLEAMKVYAAGKGMSVSELVESYFRQVTRPVERQNILDMVDRLEAPDMDKGGLNGGHGALEIGGEEVSETVGSAGEVKHGL
jgi:hypothetical protein